MDADHGALANIASVIAAFGVAMLFFRIQRELQMEKEGEHVWVPLADWLQILATLICLTLVIVPIVFLPKTGLALPAAASVASAILVAGYVLAILAHYRVAFGRTFGLFGAQRKGQYENPEPAERMFFIISLVIAIIVALLRFFQ